MRVESRRLNGPLRSDAVEICAVDVEEVDVVPVAASRKNGSMLMNAKSAEGVPCRTDCVDLLRHAQIP